MNIYTVLRSDMPDGLILFHERYGAQYWAYTKLRKDFTCMICRRVIVKGEKAFHPASDKANRNERICYDCASKLHPRMRQ